MVKALFLGLLAAMMCGFACAAPAPQPELPSRREETTPPPQPPLEDPAARSERSTNLSHVTGTARKIQMFIKNRHLQLLPDGTVNGTTDDTSAYSESSSPFFIPRRFRRRTRVPRHYHHHHNHQGLPTFPTLQSLLIPNGGFSGTAPTSTRSN